MTDRVINESSKRITNPYGGSHKGVDLGWRSDESQNKVYTNCKGEVVEIQDGLENDKNASGVKSWGNYVLIKHGNGYHTRYAHLRSGILVKKGQEVDENTQLGVIGDSGNAYGRHLHFEVATGYSSTTRIDPTPYLTKAIYEEPAKPTEPTKSVEELANEVIAGKWGNGQERKDKITAAGYDYSAVQNKVNELLGGITSNSNGLKVGDKVKIVGTGNGASDGSSNTAYGIGWEREILKIYEGREYPYQVGNSSGTTGFYKASSLQKL